MSPEPRNEVQKETQHRVDESSKNVESVAKVGCFLFGLPS